MNPEISVCCQIASLRDNESFFILQQTRVTINALGNGGAVKTFDLSVWSGVKGEYNTESTNTAFQHYLLYLDTPRVFLFFHSFFFNNIFQALSVPIVSYINRLGDQSFGAEKC